MPLAVHYTDGELVVKKKMVDNEYNLNLLPQSNNEPIDIEQNPNLVNMAFFICNMSSTFNFINIIN